ncbi:PREDICTED: probable G-protein coupled receptor Mth-like 1 [Drosophila arizonae]|uniref:Probable G-protein coupled receptor Mth-like 1 n=1 Tax=Drosophila arizonae TaxID=7263 RepID=A0ABM1PQX8_DROAR|nr:PREDICTED: probable G-protein coupled receptor Mth-like 1 [Drosophila arizonae]XP_017869614.1 PREDICTED: probable G-protein coupled receptor Mth-like 1 [Drosophila arizonae]
MKSFWLLLALLIGTANSQEDLLTTTTTAASPGNASGRPPPPRVLINKCCHHGEYLIGSTLECVAGSSEKWVPLVYLKQQNRFFEPRGAKPRFMKFLPNVRPPCQAQGQQQELFSSRDANVVLLTNGTMKVHERGLFIEPSRYCVDQGVALVCLDKDKNKDLETPAAADGAGASASTDDALRPASSTAPMLRLRKCCGKCCYYDTVAKTCSVLTPAERGSDSGQLNLPNLETGSYQTTYELPDCKGNGTGYAIAGDWHEATLNRSSGSLQLSHTNLTAAQFCLEHTQRAGEVKIIACAQHFADDHNNISYGGANGNLQKAVLDVGIIISIIFLAATLVAGYMLPAVHHALHWRCQIYYVFCLLVGKILLAIEELSTSLEPGTASCLLIAIGMQFFFLSAFFWLNTMCFNIWWTFRDFRPSSLERNQESIRLRLYSVYAWGLPLLICAIAAFVDQLPETETSMLRPGFGQPFCWFDNRSLTIFAYFYGPIGLLLCANIVLFISTTHQLTCGLWKRDDVKSTSEKSALGRVCLKLVVVMGVTWIWDIISWLVGGPHGAWLLTDLINALQGVFIFIVVGCQPQVWTACKRICCPRLRHDITNTTNGVQHSSSSQGLPSMANGTEFTQNISMNNTITTMTPASPTTEDAPTSIPAPCSPTTQPPSIPQAGAAAAATTTAKIPLETIC